MTLYLFIALVLLNIADVWTTMRILKADGKEETPLVKRFMDRFGDLEGMLILKVPLLSAFGVALAFCAEYVDLYGVRLWAWWVLVPLIARYVWVVANNVRVLRAMP